MGWRLIPAVSYTGILEVFIFFIFIIELFGQLNLFALRVLNHCFLSEFGVTIPNK